MSVAKQVRLAVAEQEALVEHERQLPEVRGADPAACNPLGEEGEYDPSNISFKHSLI